MPIGLSASLAATPTLRVLRAVRVCAENLEVFPFDIRGAQDIALAFEALKGGGQIDHEIELGRLFDRQVVRLRSAQNLVDIIGGAPSASS